MFHVILYKPEIPPNTGNIMRLCANTGTKLHLVGPYGFDLDDTRLRRAGLDYREWAEVEEHANLTGAVEVIAPRNLYAFSRDGNQRHTDPRYQRGDALLFGPESDGLPQEVLTEPYVSEQLRIPMLPRSRSLNLANAVSIVLYEAWRQRGFAGGV